MHNEFTAVIERDGEWYIAYCPQIPGANGQGRSKEEARIAWRKPFPSSSRIRRNPFECDDFQNCDVQRQLDP